MKTARQLLGDQPCVILNEHEYGGPDPAVLVLLQRNQGSGTFDLFFGDLVREDINPDLIDMNDLTSSLDRFAKADFMTPEGNPFIPGDADTSLDDPYQNPELNDFIPR